MTDPSRGVRVRRVNRRPGWVLLTVLLVLAIVASTVLVFTNRVELLKLAVVLSLWAAVAAAFVSFIYRRQSDLDQAKVRDLKYVYDLQLDREISARREYELAVEAQLRRELSAELRAQAADEVAALRAELAALRTNLEILFDTDLEARPALETDRPAGRVIASRVDTPGRTEFFPPPRPEFFPPPRPAHEPHTEESPIIDVPAEPHPPEFGWTPAEPVELFGGAHRRPSETEDPAPWQRHAATPTPAPPTPPPPAPQPPTPTPAPPPPPQWTPPPPAPAPAPPVPAPPVSAPQPAPEPTAPEVVPDRRGRHYGSDAEQPPAPRRARHAVPGETEPAPPRRRRAAPEEAPVAAAAEARHRSADEPPAPAEEPEAEGGQHAGGQPVSELLSRLQATPTTGGRRRRREE
ncbi:DUF6779 domain-containing protein [Mycobacterium sp. AMU20-3851]|uniref:DUF6779 domain-containing protein n=1 Tax=Mycobacterium sp. AMU20-3851 TaxID=3122055 RepID=UPI00375469C5